ncbi:galectin-8 isoform X2 [Rhinatrema bivittatum]|uniref:galectin-8 isoform X2 n=1 Tax=Rhinatrema bivittatum TaxID=194408 RepID=UPI00112E2561|nr:galectin-8 isoform X2 [Rhinatrema bivittatum]
MAAIVLRWSVKEPVVPFQQLLADGLYAGEMLVMHGSVSQDADRFHVNFTCRDRKSESYDDVAFHFNPRFKRSGCIVCNTLQEEKWGREEITYKMPFEKGKLFKAIFLVFSDNFQVAVNDKHLLQYNHRINLEKVNEIAVYGNVKLRSIECLSLTPSEGLQPLSLGAVTKNEEIVVPYVETIHGGLNAGEMVVIHGSVSQDADKFEVDFQCGGSNTPCCNIPFHFNPRFNPSECIVCNTLAGGKWGTEEITYEMPFEKGKPFKAIFFVFSDNFQVAVNDKHLLLYNHRINLEKVDTLGIYGNVKVQSIEFVSMTGENSRIAPLAKKAAGKPLISGKPFKPAHQGPDKHKDRGKDSQRSQPDKHTRRVVPYVGTIHGGLNAGEMVVIHGSVSQDADRFQVDFQCGDSKAPRADVAFHFNPRFKRSGCIVCNTLQEEKWGREEITYKMPFEKGKPFKAIFLVLSDKFQVAVKDKHLLLYNHRINLEKVDTLGIYGNVKVRSIEFVSMIPSEGLQPLSLGAVTMDKEIGENLRIAHLVIPYIGRLCNPLGPGRTIVVKGEVNKDANSFSIDLKPSGSNDIALHLNPRMRPQVFVRNSYFYESWGDEERSLPDFPFSPGMFFEMIIYCDTHEYKVAVNGVHILDYKHRFKNLNDINVLQISGDIRLLDVRSW